MVGIWSSQGYLSIADNHGKNPSIEIYGKNGQLSRRIEVDLPGAGLVHVHADCFASAADGTVAVCGTASSDAPAGFPFLALYGPDGILRFVSNTTPYFAQGLTIAADGNIWTVGIEGVAGKEINPEHLILRRFDQHGVSLGGSAPRSQFPPGQHPATLTRSILVASSDRVGWYSTPAKLYTEFSLDGKEIGRYTIDLVQDTVRVGMCGDSSLWVTSTSVQNKTNVVAELDRTHSAWVKRPASTGKYIVGCDNGLLGFKTGNTISWVQQH